ncbi:MAG: ATP-dependent Clp protease ATP-binding subunit [Burkholderiales bacterium]|nr:ATP-dependent Clp protease ATP-binding subunit [Burkholderiales bacterium]
MPLNPSENTERVRAQAIDLSRAWRHHYLGIEHLFTAACRLDGACGAALSGVGIPVSEMEEAILELVPLGDETPLWDGIPETPRLRRLMKAMVSEEAESVRALRIEPVHLLAATLREGRSVPCRILLSRGVDLEALRTQLLTGRSNPVASASRQGTTPGSRVAGQASPKDPKKEGKEKFLDKFGRDLVALARQGKVDPVVGRQDEIRRTMQILTRKTKSNPVLIGEAGVGKTAVAYGLALRIAQGTVPDALKGRRLVELNLPSMVAGARHRGEFEERLQGVMEELTADPSVIVFIDEIHQIVGAGDSRGGMDAGNIMKPALARGDFAVMGATTTDEYRSNIEKDPALERRFQPVMVSEPSEEDALEILKGLRPRYEQHHGVSFPDEVLLAAVKLSVRFLPERNLPDKAIDLIDESAARVKTRSGVFAPGASTCFEVTEDVVAEVVADWTGIPVSRITSEEEARLLDMENLLRGRVVGQDHAVGAVARTIRVIRVGLASPNRPGGVFLFMGPSGVGKTELAKALAEFLFGSEREMVRLDMSEFHDKHSIARLVGAPPGYVGYEGEGQLTRAVRTRPFCVLLLDEVEKAHPDVFDIFLQVFDDGRLTDAKGRTVNFTNSIIIMTSNLGSRAAAQQALNPSSPVAAAGEATPPAPRLSAPPTDVGFVGQLDSMPVAYQNALRGHFRPEFLNRIDEIVVFRTLQREDLRGIVQLNLDRQIRRIQESRQIDLELTPEAVEFLLTKGYHPEFGARPLQRAINTWLTKPFAEEILRSQLPPGTHVRVLQAGEGLRFESVVPGYVGDTLGGAP